MVPFDMFLEHCLFAEIVHGARCQSRIIDQHDPRYVEYFKSVTSALNERKDFPYSYLCGTEASLSSQLIPRNTHTRCLQIGHMNSLSNRKLVMALEIPCFNYLGICFINDEVGHEYQYCIMNNTLWVRALLTMTRSKSRSIDDRLYGCSLSWKQMIEKEDQNRDPLKLNDPLYVRYIKPLVDKYVEHDESDNINYFKRV